MRSAVCGQGVPRRMREVGIEKSKQSLCGWALKPQGAPFALCHKNDRVRLRILLPLLAISINNKDERPQRQFLSLRSEFISLC